MALVSDAAPLGEFGGLMTDGDLAIADSVWRGVRLMILNLANVPWQSASLGGILIGLSATVLLAVSGRIAGISGMINGALTFQRSERWRWWFLAGMLVGGVLYEYIFVPTMALESTPIRGLAPVSMILGGFLVGMGTRMGNGCTSGHGVCGLGRLSLRSLAAVITFLSTAMITVFIVRHSFGG